MFVWTKKHHHLLAGEGTFIPMCKHWCINGAIGWIYALSTEVFFHRESGRGGFWQGIGSVYSTRSPLPEPPPALHAVTGWASASVMNDRHGGEFRRSRLALEAQLASHGFVLHYLPTCNSGTAGLGKSHACIHKGLPFIRGSPIGCWSISQVKTE